ncbi:MAG: glycosyltransferase [Candidatus Woesearchaeota archaeon]
MSRFDISIVVITFNDVKNIGECLKSILSQDYEHNLDVLVVDGISTDGTIEEIKKYAKKHKQIRLIVERSSITEARNIGIKNAKYDFVAFTDSDCVVPKNWLKTLTEGYVRLKKTNPKIAGVGGANIPPKNINKFTYAIGIAFDSYIGSLGSIQARRFENDAQAFSISCTNSIYEKSALKKAGMFSEDLGNQGEDWDMGLKMKKKNFILYGLKDSYVIHKMRTSPKRFWDNMIFYGDGRMRLIKKHGTGSPWKYYMPLLFLVSMIMPVIYVFNPITTLLLTPILYFPFILLYSLFLCIRKKEIKYVFGVFSVFLILHFGYALGEIKGFRWFLKVK